MPMYEYQCDDCEQIFEVRQKFSDEPLTQCPTCNGSVRKVISMSGFSLQGGGWARQGYGNNSGPAVCSAASKAGGCSVCPKSPSNN